MRRRITALLLLACCLISTVVAQSGADVVRYLGEAYSVRPTDNNSVVFFKNGQEKFDDMFAAIRQARHSVHLEYFNFRNDSISDRLFSLLAERAAGGVQVRALFDGFGNLSNNRPLKRAKLDSLRACGIEIYEFDPMRFPWINHALHRDHRKIVVIDGVLAYTGGMNVADYYIKGKASFGEWRDVHCRVEGDAVDRLQAVFIDFWNRVTGQCLQGPEYYSGGRDARKMFNGLQPDMTPTARKKRICVVDKGPKSNRRIIHNTFIRSIDVAENQIQIVNPYFTLCRHIRRSLRKAIGRGVDVQIMVSAKSDVPVTPRIVEYTVSRLMDCGAHIFIYEGGFHHSKIMMVDSCFSFVGSANLNSRSLTFDYECNLLVDDVFSTRQLQNIFENDKLTRCFRLTPERWQRYPRWQRFKGWLFHFLTPFVDNKSSKTRDFETQEIYVL